MRSNRIVRIVVAAGLVAGGAGTALGDYYSYPELRPDARCRDIPPGIGSEDDPGGAESLHCQKLFWDLPVVTEVGVRAVAAPYAKDSVPRFPNGVTDRIPPLFVGEVDGAPDGFERLEDCEREASGCHRLCPDPFQVPYWAPLENPDGSPVIGTDDFGFSDAYDPELPQTGPLFEVACRRGTRTSFGPWQTGGTVDPAACKEDPGSCEGPVFDRVHPNTPVHFRNTARIDDDVANGRSTDDQRVEWSVASEIYNHFSSHHGTCYVTSHACANANSPKPPGSYDANDPSAECHDYARSGEPNSACYAGDADPRCREDGLPSAGPRNATQLPGRLGLSMPDDRGFLEVEDAVWLCNHHVVTQLPPGSYGMPRLANYRLQTHGLVNPHPTDTIYGTPPGEEFGGAVGEMIVQNFTEAMDAGIRGVNIFATAAQDLATTYYPPFTWNYHEQEWPPPFDAYIGLAAIHSHHRMVKGVINKAPVNPDRPNGSPDRGGPRPDGQPSDLYTSWYWEDAPVCEYWKEPEGPVVARKGELLRTTCYVNNGITPEAIKHGLVAGATVETLRALGAPIPDYPETMPASTWGDPLVDSPVGRELLYGTHPPINYRVVYKCSTRTGGRPVPGASMVQVVVNALDSYAICSPNTAVDADGDYIDGGYINTTQCGGALCEPSSIVFACTGEDEMCFSVGWFWPLPRLGKDDEAMENLQGGDIDNVGTPGSTPNTDLAGGCPDCELGL